MFEDQKKIQSPIPAGPPAGLEIPKSAAKPSNFVAVIHILPKEYYDVAPKTPVKKAVAAVEPKPLPPPPAPKPTAFSVQNKKRHLPIVVIMGVLFVVVIAVGGYLFLRSIREPPPAPIVIAPEPEPESSPPLPLPPTPEPEPVRPGIDTDSDGLTDVEERTIYGSDPRNPDTDGDSFIDGNEVLHLYDPTHSGGATFGEQAVGPITSYADSGFGLTFFLPESWGPFPAATPPHEPSIVTIPIASGETFRFHAYPISSDESLEALPPHLRLFPGETFLPGRSKQGYDLLRSATQRIAMVAFGGEIVVIEYDIGTRRNINYLRTFEMVINSIEPILTE